MIIFRRALLALTMVLSVLAGLFVYFIYVPAIERPLLSGDFEISTLVIDGHSRRFSWYKPESLEEGAPLIFVLHGSKGTGEQIRSTLAYEFDLLAEEHRFIVVYPDGYKNHWNDCRASADYAANIENIDDVEFFNTIIHFFSERYAVDKGKVFATGHSNGGHMVYRLGLEAPQLFAAIAPVSANLPVSENMDCHKSGEAISVAIFNGTKDPVNPFSGGLVTVMGNESRGRVVSSRQTADYWSGLFKGKIAFQERQLAKMDDHH